MHTFTYTRVCSYIFFPIEDIFGSLSLLWQHTNGDIANQKLMLGVVEIMFSIIVIEFESFPDSIFKFRFGDMFFLT